MALSAQSKLARALTGTTFVLWSIITLASLSKAVQAASWWVDYRTGVFNPMFGPDSAVKVMQFGAGAWAAAILTVSLLPLFAPKGTVTSRVVKRFWVFGVLAVASWGGFATIALSPLESRGIPLVVMGSIVSLALASFCFYLSRPAMRDKALRATGALASVAAVSFAGAFATTVAFAIQFAALPSFAFYDHASQLIPGGTYDLLIEARVHHPSADDGTKVTAWLRDGDTYRSFTSWWGRLDPRND